MKRLAFTLAFSLLAAACGGGDSGPAAVAPTSNMVEGGSGDQTPVITPGDSGDTPTTTAGNVEPADLPESDYPDVVVTDLAGGTVNLRELALGSQPTLVWFWAPH